ncbi:MAG: ABC transporter permease, partial [Chloroflexi bacterium]|nr:ABC transporter permease [Chloroflexota bacterium]
MASQSMRRRAVVYAFTLWVVLTLNFLLPRLLPGDPLLSLVDPSDATLYDAQTRQQLAAYHGLDKPMPVQYVRYWQNLLRGDLGESISFKQPVSNIIAGRLPWTLALVLPSLLISSAIALVAGAQAGWRRGTLLDRALTVLFMLMWNLPAFFIGFLLLMLFAVQLRWLPLSGAITRFAHYDSPTAQLLDVMSHWLLPATTLILSTSGGRFLLMRNTMVNVLGQDYVLVAHAKGLP